MRRLLSFVAACLTACAPAVAQTQIDLGTQVKGQLPPANAASLVQAATGAALSAVFGANGTQQDGVRRGANATNGYDEYFASDMRCVPGTSNAAGFDYTANLNCALPGFFNASSGTFDVERTFAYGVTNAQPPSPTHFAMTATGLWSANTNGRMGVSTCAPGTYNCSDSNAVYLNWNGNGLYLTSSGVGKLLWAPGGNGSGQGGTTDSSVGSGWAAPSLGSIYAFSLILPGDGTAIVSAMPAGTYAGNPCFPAGCSFAVRVPLGVGDIGALPSGSFHQFFVRGGTGDYIGDISVADGYTIGNGTSPVYDLISDPRVHVPRIVRWALHTNGAECSYASIYATPSADCTNVFALIPPNYSPNLANPWWLQVRGIENSTISFYSTFGGLNATLFDAGLVGVFGDWHGTSYYGAPHDLQDLANAVTIVRASLSVASRPHVLSDSAGCLVTANAITHGLLQPKTWQGYSCNLNLLSDAQGNNQANQQQGVTQMPLIEQDYGFGASAQYSTYTSGFDPLPIVQNPSQAFTNSIFGGSYPLLPNAAYVLASVPTLFVSDQDPGDAIVNQSINTTAFYNAVNAISPGTSKLVYLGGGHTSANKFVGSTALNWINSH
jgi:hypothetical protein